MIKQYTFTTVAEHDADYVDYRPNHVPAATCGYPYDLVYPTAYPTSSVIKCKKDKHKKLKKLQKIQKYHNEKKFCPFMLAIKIVILVLIFACVFNLINK